MDQEKNIDQANKYIPKAPFVLVIIAVFIIFLTGIEIYNFWLDGKTYPMGYMLRPALAILYTTCWIAACYLQKWGMFMFVGLSALSLGLATFLPEAPLSSQLLSLWQETIPLNIILAMLLLLFFKKFK